MKRYCYGACVLLLLGGAVAYAQELATLGNGGAVQVNRGYARLGAGVRLEFEGTTNDAFEFSIVSGDVAADYSWILPATNGSAGQQLQTDGQTAAQLSWASAASTRDAKVLDGLLDPQDALRSVIAAPVHRFHYKPGAGTLDTVTQYAGIVADEAPWAMHHNGTILNPINTAGFAFAAIQAQQAQIDALKAEIAALKAGR